MAVLRKKKMKTIRAGRQVRQIIYSVPYSSDSPKVRGSKKSASTAAQKLLNRKHSYEKAEDLIAENFDVGDLVVTLTYRKGNLPVSRKAAEARMKKFRNNIRQVFRAMKWSDPVIFWVTEEKHGDGRLHHHIIVKRPPGKCYAIIRKCWPWGDDIDFKKLRVDAEKNYESIAKYLCKEEPELGKHQWHITRNASRPDVDVRWVDGSEMIKPPKGSLVFNTESFHDYYTGAAYQYSKYVVPLQRRKNRKQ